MQVRGLHIYRPFFLQNIARFSRFVVERNVRANGLHVFDLFVGASRRNNLQTFGFGQLNDDTEEQLSK